MVPFDSYLHHEFGRLELQAPACFVSRLPTISPQIFDTPQDHFRTARLKPQPCPAVMFNRNNLPNPFGQRPESGPRPPPRDGHGTPGFVAPSPQRPGGPQGYDSRMAGGYEDHNRQPPPGYSGREQPFPQPRDYPPSQRPPVGRSAPGARMSGGGGRVWQLRPAKSPAEQYTFGNL